MGSVQYDTAYTAMPPGGFGRVGGLIEAPFTAQGNRAWTSTTGNPKPVAPLEPDHNQFQTNKVGTVGVAYSNDWSLAFTAKAVATAISRYVVIGTLPAGLTIAAATGVVSGTPAAGSAGSYPCQVRAECDTGVAICVSNTFILTINP